MKHLKGLKFEIKGDVYRVIAAEDIDGNCIDTIKSTSTNLTYNIERHELINKIKKNNGKWLKH